MDVVEQEIGSINERLTKSAEKNRAMQIVLTWSRISQSKVSDTLWNPCAEELRPKGGATTAIERGLSYLHSRAIELAMEP